MARRERVLELVRYGIVGLTVNLVLFFVYLLLTGAGLDPKLAATAVYWIGFAVSFLSHRRWTFRARGRMGAQARRYLAVHVGVYGVNMAGLYVLVDRVGLAHAIVEASLIVLSAGLLYVGQRWLVYGSQGAENAC